MSDDPRLHRAYELAANIGVRPGGQVPARCLIDAGFSIEEYEAMENGDGIPVVPDHDLEIIPLYEYRLPTPGRGAPLRLRVCRGAVIQIGTTVLHTISGPRLAEVFELMAEHLRGPTTSDPTRMFDALQRIRIAGRDEELIDLQR